MQVLISDRRLVSSWNRAIVHHIIRSRRIKELSTNTARPWTDRRNPPGQEVHTARSLIEPK